MRTAEQERKHGKQYRDRHRKLGLCSKCPEKKLPKKSKCARHHAESLRLTKSRRARRRTVGLCTYCENAASVDRQLCKDHLISEARRSRLRRGTPGFTKEQAIKRRHIIILARVKAEMGKSWNAEVEKFVRDNIDLFWEKFDPAIYNSMEIKDALL